MAWIFGKTSIFGKTWILGKTSILGKKNIAWLGLLLLLTGCSLTQDRPTRYFTAEDRAAFSELLYERESTWIDTGTIERSLQLILRKINQGLRPGSHLFYSPSREAYVLSHHKRAFLVFAVEQLDQDNITMRWNGKKEETNVIYAPYEVVVPALPGQQFPLYQEDGVVVMHDRIRFRSASPDGHHQVRTGLRDLFSHYPPAAEEDDDKPPAE